MPEVRETDPAVEDSVRYLSSPAALASISTSPYWPKWNSPWWHIAVLHEMGHADRIPQVAVKALTAAIRAQYPQDGSPAEASPCPCEIGNIFQILTATGVDVDRELPWARAWLLSQQMPDGGLSCDESAYSANPPARSIVATIAALEAILLCTPRPFTAEEMRFLDAGAQCLIERKLLLGCTAPHNAEEHEDEVDWIRPCFPRFYLYDVLRGLTFVLRWAEKRQKKIPAEAIEDVVSLLRQKSPDGRVRTERHAFEGVGSREKLASGDWQRRAASHFPLLDEVSRLGAVSPFLTRQWNEAEQKVARLS